MEELEIKENRCFVDFICIDSNAEPCVYRIGKDKCKYNKNNSCESLVARVNKMTILRKKYLGEE